MLAKQGILTEEERLRASGIIAKKYQVDLSDIWDRNYLINDTDRANVAKWLREHNGESLVKSECICPSSQIQALKNAGIIYEEETTMNTNAVKAFLIDQLGQKGSPAVITKEDLPKGLNFYQFDEMEVVVK